MIALAAIGFLFLGILVIFGLAFLLVEVICKYEDPEEFFNGTDRVNIPRSKTEGNKNKNKFKHQ